MKEALLTPHAEFELKRRSLTEAMVRGIIEKPEQSIEVRKGRWVYQSRISMGSPPKTYLVRIRLDIDRVPTEIVTAYRTTKIEKYWRKEE
jgi:hypothetical protein